MEANVDSKGTHEGQAKCSCAAASILAVAAVAAEAASTVASGANAARASFDEEKKYPVIQVYLVCVLGTGLRAFASAGVRISDSLAAYWPSCYGRCNSGGCHSSVTVGVPRTSREKVPESSRPWHQAHRRINPQQHVGPRSWQPDGDRVRGAAPHDPECSLRRTDDAGRGVGRG